MSKKRKDTLDVRRKDFARAIDELNGRGKKLANLGWMKESESLYRIASFLRRILIAEKKAR